jgi:hypothetical protein
MPDRNYNVRLSQPQRNWLTEMAHHSDGRGPGYSDYVRLAIDEVIRRETLTRQLCKILDSDPETYLSGNCAKNPDSDRDLSCLT